MDKLISANAVLEVLGCFTDTEHGNPHFLNGIATARESVEDAPEAVVRCKDCKWYEIWQIKRDGTGDKRFKPSVCVRGTYAQRRRADWYCADGERREDETD